MKEIEQKESGLTLRWLYLCWLGTILAPFAIGIVGVIARGNPEPFIRRLGTSIGVFAVVIYAVGMVVAFAILSSLLRKRGIDWKSIGLRGKLSPSAVGYALGCAIVAVFLYQVVEFLMESVGIGMGVSITWSAREGSSLNSPLEILLVATAAVAVFPITEEVIFRGYVLTTLKNKLSKPLVAVVLSALMFSSTHVFVGPGMMVYIFLWAFMPAFLYLRFDSLYPAVLFHGLSNLVAYIIYPLWYFSG